MITALNRFGEYVGDVERAIWLLERGVDPITFDDNKVCSIGFSHKNNGWYAWSHRGYGVFQTKEEAIEAAISYD